MENSNLHGRINLRALLIQAETTNQVRNYGKNSATVKSKNFKTNIGIFVSILLRPTYNF